MLAYVCVRCEQGHPMCDEDETITLLVSIEHAVCKAAGLPRLA
jgi:hypothetical protein